MDILKQNNKMVIENIKDFNLTHIFECGQCFRWNKEQDGSYTGVVFDNIINVKQEDSKVVIENTNKDEFSVIENYFDLKNDYSYIKKTINTDEIMDKAINFGEGIRILNQDEWEIMISFMISANNRIPMIKKVIENLSIAFGNYLGNYKGKNYYSFPKAEILSEVPVDEILLCKAGFRAPRIKEAASRFLNEKQKIYNIKNLSYDEGLEYLKTYAGIGDKVANCILLFSMKHYGTFPVDVWVRRVMQELYVGKNTKDKDIRTFAENKFGKFSGYAQQYLFYYARENGIGK